MNGKEYFEKFSSLMEKKSDDEIICSFNKEVGVYSKKGWETARASFLAAIHNEFNKREFDYSIIGNKEFLSLKSKIELNNKTITIVNETQTELINT